MAKKEDFNPHVLIPPGLTTTGTQKAIDYIEKTKRQSGLSKKRCEANWRESSSS